MTPVEQADAARERWIVVRLGGSLAFLVLIAVAVVLLLVVKAVVVGFVVLVFALVFRIALPFVSIPFVNRPGTDSSAGWWYNYRTGEVEQGRISPGADRYGPYATRDEAQRAPEIVRERAARWNAED